MSRVSQYAGLSPKALEFLDKNSKRDIFHIVKSDRVIETRGEYRKEVYSTIGDAFPLYRYFLVDGSSVYEYVQASQPVCFIALRDEAGNPIVETLWSAEEMESCVAERMQS